MVAAVHRDDFSGDVARPVGAQESHDLRDLATEAESPERDGLERVRTGRLVEVASRCRAPAMPSMMTPGATLLARTPKRPSSTATARTRASTPAFGLADSASRTGYLRSAPVVTATSDPFVSRRWGNTAYTRLKKDFSSLSTWLENWSGESRLIQRCGT